MTWTSVGQFGRDEVDTRCVPMCVFELVQSPFLVLSEMSFLFSYLSCTAFYSLLVSCMNKKIFFLSCISVVSE